jgi:GT2 family glycosyltransferase
MQEDLLVSYIVVTHQSEKCIEPCLRSVSDFAPPGRSEIIVVDTGSTDGTAERVNHGFPRVKWVPAHANLGYAGAINLGAGFAQGRILAFLNPDIEIQTGPLDAIRRILLDEGYGIVSCRIIDPHGRDLPHRFKFPSFWESVSSAFLPFLRRRALDPNVSGPTDWMVGCFGWVRRDAFDRVQGFDPRYFLFAEEIDFYYRLRRAGWKAWYTAEVTAVHREGQSRISIKEASEWLSYKNRYRFVETSLGIGRGILFRLGAIARLLTRCLVGKPPYFARRIITLSVPFAGPFFEEPEMDASTCRRSGPCARCGSGTLTWVMTYIPWKDRSQRVAEFHRCGRCGLVYRSVPDGIGKFPPEGASWPQYNWDSWARKRFGQDWSPLGDETIRVFLSRKARHGRPEFSVEGERRILWETLSSFRPITKAWWRPRWILRSLYVIITGYIVTLFGQGSVLRSPISVTSESPDRNL